MDGCTDKRDICQRKIGDLLDDRQAVISILQFVDEFVEPNVGHPPGSEGRVCTIAPSE